MIAEKVVMENPFLLLVLLTFRLRLAWRWPYVRLVCWEWRLLCLLIEMTDVYWRLCEWIACLESNTAAAAAGKAVTPCYRLLDKIRTDMQNRLLNECVGCMGTG